MPARERTSGDVVRYCIHCSLNVSPLGHSLVVALICGLAGTASRAADEGESWPFVRGPDYDGHSRERGIADEWPGEGPPVLWTRELGTGYSGFVAWDDRCCTQYQTLGGQFVLCLNAETGETIWEHRYDWPYEPGGVYPGPRATPTYHAGRVYFAGPSGLIGCLQAGNGDLLWSRNVVEQFNSDGIGFGYSCSPVVEEGKVLLPVGGSGASMVALDADDGSVVWASGDDPASYTPAYPITFRGRRLVLGYLQNALVCRDLETGEEQWRWELSHGYDEHSAWPIYDEPHLWISGPFRNGCQLLKLTGDEQRPVESVYQSSLMSNDIFSSVLVDGAVFGFDVSDAQAKTHRPTRGRFRCLDFLTGEEQWSAGDDKPRRSIDHEATGDAGERIGHATVIVADSKLILMNDTGELILARADRAEYEELARVPVLTGEICWTQPTLHGERLFVRNHSQAACLFLGTADRLPPSGSAGHLTVSDIPQAEYFDLAGAILGIEPEYAFDVPSSRWLREWYLASLGLIGVSLSAGLLVRIVFGAGLGPSASRWAFWATAFVLGALGTTFLSRWRGDFVFTWPVSIFVAFEAAVAQIRVRGADAEGVKRRRWRSRLVGVGFIGVCVAYFLLCRRLSLVFEWVFLCGFGAALPFSLAGLLCFRQRSWRPVWQGVMTVAAFSGFYWSSVGLLFLKS